MTEKQLSEFMLRHPSEERYAINWLPAKIINRVMEMQTRNGISILATSSNVGVSTRSLVCFCLD